MSKIKTQLVVEGKNNASKALKEVDGQLLGISSAAKKAGAALLGAFSVVAIGSWIKNSIVAADQARKLAQAAGLSTEAFTGLQFAASQSGVSVNDLSGALTRLSRSMSDAATIGGRPAAVFTQLGISVRDSEGNLRSADAVLSDLADKFKAMPDGVGKTAAAVELLGRSGAKLIPLLNGGAEGIKALTDQAERLGLVISDNQAAAAERYNDSLAALGGASRGAANTISGELLPTLNEMSGLLLSLVEDGDSAKTMAQVFSFALKSLATVVLAVGNTFGNLGRLIGATAAAAVAAAKGDFSEAGQIFREVTADNEKAANDTEQRIKKMWNGELGKSGEAAAKVVSDYEDVAEAARESAERSNRAFADSYTSMVSSAKSALKDLVSEEKKTQKQLEDLGKERLAIEQRYAEAIAGFSAGTEGPSYAQAQDLKIDGRRRLAAGDVDGAKKSAEAALKVLQELASSGENTFGFAGFAKELQAIELQANKIEQTDAEKKLASIADQIEVLNKRIAGLAEFNIKLELSDAEKQKIISQMEELRKLLGQPISIQAQIATASAPAVDGYASGGRISGPGTGTSDSILARLSNGEYVVKADAVRKYGTNMLDNLNGMRLPKFADGGMVGDARPAASGTPVFVQLDGRTFGLNGPSDTVAEMAQFFRKQKLKGK